MELVFLLASSDSTCIEQTGVSGICKSFQKTFTKSINQKEIRSCRRVFPCDVKCCPFQTVWNEDEFRCMIPDYLDVNETIFIKTANLQCRDKIHVVENHDPNSNWINVNGEQLFIPLLMNDYCIDFSENSFENASFIAFICRDEHLKNNKFQIVVLIVSLVCFIFHAVRHSIQSFQDKMFHKLVFHHWSCVTLTITILINESKDSMFLVFFGILACFSCIIIDVKRLHFLVIPATAVAGGFALASHFLLSKVVLDLNYGMSVLLWFFPLIIPLAVGMIMFMIQGSMQEWTVYFAFWICHIFFPFQIVLQMLFMFLPMIQTVFNFAFYSEFHKTGRKRQDLYSTIHF